MLIEDPEQSPRMSPARHIIATAPAAPARYRRAFPEQREPSAMSTEPLRTFLQIAYYARRSLGNERAAFERAVSVLLRRFPMLSAEEARQHVERILAVDPPPADDEPTVPTYRLSAA